MTEPTLGCPFHGASAAAEVPVPARIAKLPVLRGFHVPWFVEKINGEFDFRVMSREKLIAAVRDKLCWVCGEPLGKFQSFVIGTMCTISRTSGEPPSHHECAVYSAKTCPFLTMPHMKRRDHDKLKEMTVTAGESLDHNPGVCAVWTTRAFHRFGDGRGGILFNVGEPEEVEWFARGRPATREEVLTAVAKGLPRLRELCATEATPEGIEEAHQDLNLMIIRMQQYLPEEGPTEEEQRTIDQINKMDHMEMCRLWRFAKAGHPYFDTSKPYYAVFKARLDAFGGFTPEISKAIGH